MSKAPEIITRPKSRTIETMFLPYQVAVIRDKARYHISEKARRIGLTFGYGYKYTRKRAEIPGKTWYTANDASTVLEFIDYIGYFARYLNSAFDVFDEQLIVDEKEILTKTVRFKDGGEVRGLSSNPTALHGKGGDFIGDEFAYHKQAATMWEAGQATAGWGDDIIILSTHTSVESQFNQLISQAKRLYAAAKEKNIAPGSEEFRRLALDLNTVPWSYRRLPIQAAVGQGLVEKINKTKGTTYTREDFLKECRAKCLTEDQWKRQYLCEPSSDASSLLPYNLILTCAHENCLKPVSTLTNIFQGGDFARRGHNTSIASGEKLGDVLWLRALERMKGKPWREQLAFISAIARLPQFQRGAYDQTGMGDMPVEELQTAHGEWRMLGIKFTQQSKANLANPLRRRFDDRTIRIPQDQALYDSLNKVRATTIADGRTIFTADDVNDEHADDFWSIAMMNHVASLRGSTGKFEII